MADLIGLDGLSDDASGQPVLAQGEIYDYKITGKRYGEGPLDICRVGDEAHNGRTNCSTDDRHDQQRRANLGIRSQAFEAESKDGWEHDRMKKPDQDDRPEGSHAGAEKNHKEADQSRERKQ